MITKETREILKSLTTITDKFILETPKTVFTDEFKQIVCAIDTEVLGEDFEEPIYINDMTTFLSAVDLIDDPQISIKNRVINIKNDISSINYLTSDSKSMPKTEYKVIESTKKFNSKINFTLNKDLIDTIRKAVSVFKNADTLFITKKGNSLELVVSVNETFDALSNDFSTTIEFEGESDDFEIKVPVKSVLKIPAVEYNVEVKYNEDKDAYRLYLSNSIIEIVMSTIR
jgi:hypothetical protein